MSNDPLIKSYPWYAQYQFVGNKPIVAIDLDGLEESPENSDVVKSDPNYTVSIVSYEYMEIVHIP